MIGMNRRTVKHSDVGDIVGVECVHKLVKPIANDAGIIPVAGKCGIPGPGMPDPAVRYAPVVPVEGVVLPDVRALFVLRQTLDDLCLGPRLLERR